MLLLLLLFCSFFRTLFHYLHLYASILAFFPSVLLFLPMFIALPSFVLPCCSLACTLAPSLDTCARALRFNSLLLLPLSASFLLS